MTTYRKIQIVVLAALTVFPLLLWLIISGEMYLTPFAPPNFSGEITNKVRLKDPAILRLAVLGDCRSDTPVLEFILRDIEGKADAAVILGDLVNYGAPILYRFFLRELYELNLSYPVFFVIGNHDLYLHDNGDLFRRFFGPDHFWWCFGGIFFIAINNVERGRWKAELEWLKQTLAEKTRPGDRIYLLMHKPPFARSEYPGLTEGQTRMLAAAIAGYPNLTIFASHEHTNAKWDFNGIPVYISGEAGAPQDKSPPSYGYLLLECSKNDCRITHHNLGYLPPHGWLETKVFVHLYWVWPLIPLFSAVGLVLILRKNRTHT